MGKLIISPKVLDSLNEINSEITTNDFGNNTVASFQTALLTFIQNNLINDGDYRSILVNISTASDVFAAQRYSGWVTKQSGSHYAITLIGINNQDIEGHYTSVSETWTWSSLNDNTTWKFHYNQSYNATTKPAIDLPSNWSELNVVVMVDNAGYCYSFQITKVIADLLVAVSLYHNAIFRQGFYVNSNDCSRVNIVYNGDHNTIAVVDAESGAAGAAKEYRIVIAYR